MALGLRYLGVLLMGSLIIIPAATAKRLARNLGDVRLVGRGGDRLQRGRHLGREALHRPPGPLIISAAAICFLASLVRRPA